MAWLAGCALAPCGRTGAHPLPLKHTHTRARARARAQHRRSFVSSVTEQLTGTLSLGAAVFASVLFASSMPSEFAVVSWRLGGAALSAVCEPGGRTTP
jgi:hypothetical protein